MSDSEVREAIVLNCQYDKPWTAPGGETVHYHRIELANGDKGNVGVADKFPPKITQGATIRYIINGNRIKLIDSSGNNGNGSSGGGGNRTYYTNGGQKNDQKEQADKKSKGSGGGGGGYNKQKSKEDYLGFCYGYAKDLIVAGKGPECINDLKIIAEHIYQHVQTLLEDPQHKTTPITAPRNKKQKS